MRSSRFAAIAAVCFAILLSTEPSFANCLSIVIPTPNVDNYNYLKATSGTSYSDIWAVGYSQHSYGDLLEDTLIEHFNGSSWSIVPSPNSMLRPGNTLTSVSASSPTDAWAVGFDNDFAGEPRTLAMHWDGTAWRKVQTHQFGSCFVWRYFTGVSVNPKNARDVWAVGWANHNCQPTTDVGIAEHWDGISWSLIKTSFSNILIDAVSSTDQGAWAVGLKAGRRGGSHPYIVRLNGSGLTEWPAAHNCCALVGVSALGPNDVWAVGYATRRSGARPIIEHFDGAAWSAVANPPISGDVGLNSVFAVTSSNVWAVGEQGPGNLPNTYTSYRTLVEHWDGLSWSVVPSADGGAFNVLSGVYGLANRAIAVGNFDVTTQQSFSLGSIASCTTGSVR